MYKLSKEATHIEVAFLFGQHPLEQDEMNIGKPALLGFGQNL